MPDILSSALASTLPCCGPSTTNGSNNASLSSAVQCQSHHDCSHSCTEPMWSPARTVKGDRAIATTMVGVLPELVGFPQRLERLRHLGNISASALSRLIGASRNTVGNLEVGISRTPRGDVLYGLAKVFGTTVEYLAAGEGEEPNATSVREALACAGYTRSKPRDEL